MWRVVSQTVAGRAKAVQRHGVNMDAPLTSRQRCLLAALSGVLLSVIYPPHGYWLLGWVALVPLLVALRAVGWRHALALGAVTGTVGGMGVTGWWITAAACDYFGLSPLPGLLFTLGVVLLFVTPAFAVFGLLAARLLDRPGAFIFLPAAFVTCEYARAHLAGNAWALLGQSVENLALLQVCDLTGVYGLSFLLTWSAHAATVWRRSKAPAAALGLLLAIVFAYGHARVVMIDALPGPSRQVELVQGNVANHERGRPERFAAHLDHYLQLRAGDPQPPLILWPEQAIGFFLADNPDLQAAVTRMLAERHAMLLTGAPRSATLDGTAVLFNSAFLLGPDGVIGVYDKRDLLPFVERRLLHTSGPYQAGDKLGVFSTERGVFGVLICFEAIYSTPARRLRQAGAEWLVNVSNDSWFETGGGALQHLQAVRLRAIEQRWSIVRVTNSGISVIIDPAGRELVRLPERTAIALSATVPSTVTRSPYTSWGDAFAWICVGISLAGLAASLRLPATADPGDHALSLANFSSR
jgi:apolipoprotein N-acyltransferase